MKKFFVLVLALLLLLGGVAQAEGLDLSGWTDDQLRAAYQEYVIRFILRQLFPKFIL